ncbi:MAG: hypothetical protein QM731_13740 [Chitinophagaceae bacterium]
MQHKQSKQQQYSWTILVAALFITSVTSSCKKEYIDKYNIIPGDTVTVSGYTYISSFTVHEFSADTALKATIKSDSIIVYWPSYKKMPDTIKPEILLPEKTAIAPASGTGVPFVTGTKFTVTAQSGSKKIYTLAVDFRQPKPSFTIYSSNQLLIGSKCTLPGDWWLTDTAKTRIYLVSADTKQEYLMELVELSGAGASFYVPANVPTTGKYDIKVINGIYTIYNDDAASRNNMIVTYPTAIGVETFGFPYTLSAGDTFIIRGRLLAETTAFYMRLSTDNSWQQLTLTSAAVDRLILKVPAGTPIGAYNRIRLVLPSGNREYARNLTVQ